LNMSSSPMAPESSHSFSDVLKALEERGRVAEAFAYKIYVLEYLSYAHQLDEEEVLKLPIDRINTLLQVPPTPAKYRGWDTFYWGGAVIK